MTKETISEIEALKAVLSDAPDHLVLAEMLGFVADRLMALDADRLCGAGRHERSAGRANQRNGYRLRAWETRAGRIDLKIPKLRKGSYFPEFLEPRRAAEKAMAAVIQGEASRRHRFEADAERCAGSLDPIRGRSGQGNGHDRRLQEPGVQAMRRYR